MGIKNLHKILKKYAPDVYVEHHLSEYAYKKVAIDISLYLFKYKAVFGDKWLSSFLEMICCLRRNEVHPLFIFDGKAPQEKKKEQDARKEQRDKMKMRLSTLEEDFETYKTTGVLTETLREFYTKIENEKPMRLLGKTTQKLSISMIENELEKLRSYNIGISKKDTQTLKEMLDVLCVPNIVAPGEAEAYASHLCLNGIVDMVLSEDTDVLVYGTPIFLTKLNASTGMVTEIAFETVLKELEMTHEEFVDMCILCGSDYNDTMKGVGPETAIRLVKTFGTIDKFPIEYDTSCLRLEQTRGMFSRQSINDSIPYCGTPDFRKVEEWLFIHNLRTDIGYVRSSFAPPKVVFI
jgi:5'-3' exonuclease